jgi:hypothetical protein
LKSRPSRQSQRSRQLHLPSNRQQRQPLRPRPRPRRPSRLKQTGWRHLRARLQLQYHPGYSVAPNNHYSPICLLRSSPTPGPPSTRLGQHHVTAPPVDPTSTSPKNIERLVGRVLRNRSLSRRSPRGRRSPGRHTAISVLFTDLPAVPVLHWPRLRPLREPRASGRQSAP